MLIEIDSIELARLRKAVRDSEAHYEELQKACEEFRDSVLHGRANLAENGMDSDQTNDVLNLFDDTIGKVIDEKGGDDE